jgi:two-component system sensor histidine kinase QseC
MTKNITAPTIRKRLLLSLISAVAILWCVVLLFAYRAAQSEVEEVFDAALAQQARVLATLLIHEAEEETERMQVLSRLVRELGDDGLQRSPLFRQLVEEYGNKGANDEQEDYLTLLSPEKSQGHHYETKIAFMASFGDDRPMLRSPDGPPFQMDHEGFYDLSPATDGWRVFGLNLSERGLRVQVGEQMSVRQETVRDILINSLWPMFLSLPILGLIIWASVGKGLRPLDEVAEKVERRDPSSLQSIPTDSVPGEVIPIVDSLNRLFQRVRNALDNERRFTANAAHELRTPLAALKTQAQVKQLDNNSVENADFLDDIVSGVDRTTHLLEQLLTLARTDTLQQEAILQQRIDLYKVVKDVLVTISEHALEKQIELSLNSPDAPVHIHGDEAALSILVRNLIDNAIRYTPTGGKVSVRLEIRSDIVNLLIEDNGPGIAKSQRDEMFQRFQRGESVEARGSGLGLSIVKQIADLHGAEVRLVDAVGGQGLGVVVVFPL